MANFLGAAGSIGALIAVGWYLNRPQKPVTLLSRTRAWMRFNTYYRMGGWK